MILNWILFVDKLFVWLSLYHPIILYDFYLRVKKTKQYTLYNKHTHRQTTTQTKTSCQNWQRLEHQNTCALKVLKMNVGSA